MAATLTRRALRRARLGGRHTYRAAARHRAPLLIAATAATVALATAGVAGEVGGVMPPRSGPGTSWSLPGPMADRPDGPHAGAAAGPMAGPMAGSIAGPMAGHVGGPGRPGRG